MVIPASVPYSSLKKIQMPFDTAVWIWILIAFIAALFFTYHRINPSRLTSFFDVINIFLGGPIMQMPQRSIIKFALSVWMLATLVLRNAYHGKMFNFLQAQLYAQPVDTLAKVEHFNYTIFVMPIVYEVLSYNMPQLRPQLRHTSLLNMFYANMKQSSFFHRLQLYDEDLSHFKLLKDPTLTAVYTVSQIRATYYNMLHRKDPDAAVVMAKQRLALFPIVFYLRKHSCLTEPINVQLTNIASSGLMKYWMNQYNDAKYTRIRNVRIPQILTLQQIQGIFYIYAVLHAVALVTFVIEIVMARCSFAAVWRLLM